MAAKGDAAILISQSGETAELDPVLDHFERVGIPVIAITGNSGSMLAERSAAALVLPHWPEVGPESVAPTTSTTMTLALGDALAMTVMHRKGFSRTDFGRLHPGGALGARLKPVSRLMHSGEAMPLTGGDSSMHDAMVEMSAKRLGVVGVVDEGGNLVGVITDGDLRRNIERGLDHKASEFMTRDPEDDRARRAGRRCADPVRRAQDHDLVRRRRPQARRRAPHPRLPAGAMNCGHPDPGALRHRRAFRESRWSN